MEKWLIAPKHYQLSGKTTIFDVVESVFVWEKYNVNETGQTKTQFKPTVAISQPNIDMLIL